MTDRVRRAGRENTAIAEYDDRRCNLEDDIHVVLNEHHRDLLPLPEFIDLIDHAPALFGAHAGGWLVEQQNLRIEHQRQRDVEQLLVAMRKRRRGSVALAGEPQHLHGIFGAIAGFGQRKASVQYAGPALIRANRGQHGFMHRERGKNTGDLEGAADAMPNDVWWRATRQIHAIEQDAAGVGLQRTRDQIEKRALAGAVGADHRSQGSIRKIQCDVLGCLDAAE